MRASCQEQRSGHHECEARPWERNAGMESFLSTLKVEARERFKTTGHAKRELFDFIELFYKQERHSTVGNIGPAEFERRARTTQVA